MNDLIFDAFQDTVNECLIRHKSILDIITKLQESESRINRAVAKSVINCGCVKINAEKQKLNGDSTSIEEISKEMKNHIDGELCDNCRHILEQEIGNNIFYLTSLCSVLGINLYDIILKEYNKMNTLGKYTLR